MTKRVPIEPAPGPLEDYAARFDDLLANRAQREGFRRYLEGLLLDEERNKTLTALANTEPVVGAQRKEAQSLQWFLTESSWDPQELNRRRVELMVEDPETAPVECGALVIDERGDRKDGKATAHVGKQYLGTVGKVENGVVSVSSMYADERLYYPLEAEPYTPGDHFEGGKSDPQFRTKPQIALVGRLSRAWVFRRFGVCVQIIGETKNHIGQMAVVESSDPLVLQPHFSGISSLV